MSDHVFRQNLKLQYPRIVRGQGAWVFDSEGKRYLDGASGGVMVVGIGHGVPSVIEAIERQARTLCYAYAGMVANEPQARLAEALVRIAPPGLERVFFVTTGTEATETAVKLARQYHLETGNPHRHKVICRWQSYHGSSFGALSYGGRSPRRKNYAPYLLGFPHIPPAYCYRCPFQRKHPECEIACARQLEVVIRQEGPDSVAAFIAEPLLGSQAGALPAPPGYFQIIREICDRYGVLMIIDEVVTGFGRTGRSFAIDHWGVVPDLIATGKGISSGYAPLAAVLVHEKIYETIESGSSSGPIGYTFAGNPLSCAAGLAVQQYLAEHDLVRRAARMGEILFRQAEDRLRDHALVGDVRGLGLLLGIEIIQDKWTKEPFDRRLRVAETIAEHAWEKGLWLLGGSSGIDGTSGDYLVLAPPLIILEEEIELAIHVLAECLEEFQAAPDQGVRRVPMGLG